MPDEFWKERLRDAGRGKDKPTAFRRLDDGELFTLNPDGETYSLKFMKERFPESFTFAHKADLFPASHFEPIYEETP